MAIDQPTTRQQRHESRLRPALGIAPPGEWNVYLVFAMFRFLAILQGVLKRGLDGNASNPMGSSVLRDVIEQLAAEARKTAKG